MSALPPEQAHSMRNAAANAASNRDSLVAKWQELHEQAAQIARMAELSPEPYEGALAAFPEQVSAAGRWQRNLVREGVEDMEAMIRPGLAALSELSQRGIAATAPALALWCEFYEARASLLHLLEANPDNTSKT